VWGGLRDLKESIDIEYCISNVSFGHETSLVRMDEGIGLVDVL
jgi:hypothetical protein